MHDDPKDVARDVKQPVINSWTENDPPQDGRERKHKPESPKSLHEVDHPNGSAEMQARRRRDLALPSRVK